MNSQDIMLSELESSITTFLGYYEMRSRLAMSGTPRGKIF